MFEFLCTYLLIVIIVVFIGLIIFTLEEDPGEWK
jgi:cbb3-type cytochrome oxidase subunit 3